MKVMRTFTSPDDVILFRTFKFNDPETGFLPVNTIDAEGITYKRGMRLLSILKIRSAVIHTVDTPILKNRMIRAGVALPRRIMNNNNFFGNGFMEK